MAPWGCHQGVTRGLGVLVFLFHAPAGDMMIDLGMALKVDESGSISCPAGRSKNFFTKS